MRKIFAKQILELNKRHVIPAILFTFLASIAIADEVNVPAYKVELTKRLNNIQRVKLFRKYANQPGTTIEGPRSSFSVRKLIRGNHVQIIAIDTKRNSLNQVGAAINHQTRAC